MGQVSYAPLWVKSNFSFLEGASHPEELVDRAQALGLRALALTDRDSVSGSVRAHVQALGCGLPLIHGAQISVGEPDELLGLGEIGGVKSAVRKTRSKASAWNLRGGAPLGDLSVGTGGPRGGALPAGRPVIALASDRSGWGALCGLLSRGRLACPKGHARVRLGELAAAGPGVIALVVDPDMLAALREPFAGRLYALVTRHRSAAELPAEARLRATAARLGVPVVAGSEVLYHDAARRPLQDVVTCVRLGLTLGTAGTAIRGNAEHELRSPAAMQALYHDDPEALARTLEVAERCSFSLTQLRYRYPAESVPEGSSEPEWLRQLTLEGARWRYDGAVPLHVRAQLERELKLIAELDYGGYFLTMWEIVQFCRRAGILCQGRGSAANSAVCYCLGITAIDPVRMDLLFERFISRERAEPPDIDLDIEHERREEVIQFVYQRYGRRRAAMVAMLTRYRPRSALRDVGKALGLPQPTIDRVAKLQSSYGGAIDAAMVTAAGVDASTPLFGHWLRLAGELENFPRHLATHPGGFLLGHEPLDSLVPLEPAAMAGRTIVQWDKHDVEDLGLFKVDLLGLGALSHVRGCLGLLREHHGVDLTMATIPAEDPATYAMLSRGDTLGVFQVESRAQMAMLPRIRPRTFYDLVIQVAIVRPGPIQGDMVHPYLRRRNGEEPVVMPHPSLARVLGKTLGVPLFQEQVMRLAMLAADYTPGEADQLRRDMGAWKVEGKIEAHHDRIVERMVAKGIEREFAERVFAQIRGFGEYGFPESHAASFALIAYVTAWLRCHYPAAFTAALLNAQPMGFYHPSTIVSEAQRRGVELRPIDVQRSAWDCTLEAGARPGQPALRMGLRMIKGLGAAEQAAFAAEPGPYASLEELVRRTRLGRPALQALAEAGALAGFGLDRRAALWAVRGLAVLKDSPLALPTAMVAGAQQPLFTPLSDGEAVAWDYRRTQHSVRGHPLAAWRPALQAVGLRDTAGLRRLQDGTPAEAVGAVTCKQRPQTAHGVTFLTLEDEAGMFNVIVWAAVRERHELLLRTAAVLGVSGKIQSAHGVVHLVAESLWDPRAAIA
ncbi:error-prone DNA polymerase [Nannocystis sp.]|uniref:error-prone DNA polymerase n=1 Tax=Nannocystis sp. TaxID=1962667 RepID=UPI0025D9E38D|nr:error-prone DNA polymerase [Nannocystis sp.]MBK7823888.1 error-prone DNA polymerase [Nannocystis sp.]